MEASEKKSKKISIIMLIAFIILSGRLLTLIFSFENSNRLIYHIVGNGVPFILMVFFHPHLLKQMRTSDNTRTK